MAELRYACGRCGTWACDACEGLRPSTDVRYVNYPCPRCWGLAGTLVPTMHTEKMWRTHNDGDLPFPYPYGQRPEPENWPDGFGPRTVPQLAYRGVPWPEPGMRSLTDMKSWKRGVDAALTQETETRWRLS